MLKRSVIAVVDDDESVREAVAGLIKSLGYVAIAFERAEDFLNSDSGRVAVVDRRCSNARYDRARTA